LKIFSRHTPIEQLTEIECGGCAPPIIVSDESATDSTFVIELKPHELVALGFMGFIVAFGLCRYLAMNYIDAGTQRWIYRAFLSWIF
jgi:hypothetical protein